ncbi:hypothetical protein H0H92_005922 [Tricholoma furcatifolium]|nr:hypothetical protein H0H92_005922 [Tricholoma furcatifolium]
MADTVSTTSSTTGMYKGKVTHRSWPQLPEELLRYCPQTWDTREAWHHRMVYAALRDANDLERHMMSICPQWHLALQHHLFWNQAVALIDPTDALGHHQYLVPKNVSLNSSAGAAQPTKISAFHHFRNITRVSCFVCRINAPNSTVGLATAKRYHRHGYLQTIALCREHDRRPTSYCGLCLRTAPIYDPSLVGQQAATAAQMEHAIAVVENDDKDSFPYVEATCRACRTEWLWKRAHETSGDREAIGGRRFEAADWETRSVIDSFLDLAEGTIQDVLIVAREKLWLKRNTRLDFLMKMLKKTNRVDNEGLEGLERYDAEEEEEEESESEDDFELMQIEEAHVRDMALGDWARARILDGHWISPADTWYGYQVNGLEDHVPAVHPCPWTCSPTLSDDPSDNDQSREHPLPSTLKGSIPPTYGLCEQAFGAHQRQLKEILIPPMKNLVRKLVIECQTPGMGRGEDPAIRASKMSIEEVLAELRNEEGVWLNGFDWVQRRMNDSREQNVMMRSTNNSSADSDDSSTSGSRSSNGTSPVLSTTTLQTTPSPPPHDEKKEDTGPGPVPSSMTVMISVDPVEDPPIPLHTVPFIPTTAAHFPTYTMEALKQTWREASARAQAQSHLQQQSNQVKIASAQAPLEQQQQLHPPPPPVKLRTIHLEPSDGTQDGDVDGEELEVNEDAYDEENAREVDADGSLGYVSEEEYEDLTSEATDDLISISEETYDELVPLVPKSPPRSPATATITTETATNVPVSAPRARKRSSDELELDEHGNEGHEYTPPSSAGSLRGGTPPKRARVDKRDAPPHTPVSVYKETEGRMRKRSSEELNDDEEDDLDDTRSKKKVQLMASDTSRPSSVPLSSSARTSETGDAR